jgi:hypothetical protein
MDDMASQDGQVTVSAHEELSDLELLNCALDDALAARLGGLVVGPVPDDRAWREAQRRARGADFVRSSRSSAPCSSCQGSRAVEDLLNGDLVTVPCASCSVDWDGAA